MDYSGLCFADSNQFQHCKDLKLINKSHFPIFFLFHLNLNHSYRHPDIQKATFENRFKLYLKASRKCLEKYRPIISIDAEFFDEAKVFKHVEAELDDPNFILLRFILDIEKYPVMGK